MRHPSPVRLHSDWRHDATFRSSVLVQISDYMERGTELEPCWSDPRRELISDGQRTIYTDCEGGNRLRPTAEPDSDSDALAARIGGDVQRKQFAVGGGHRLDQIRFFVLHVTEGVPCGSV